MPTQVKNENFITIQGWMVNELKLSGNKLLVFALIYGFTQDDETEFEGSLSYMASWCNSTKQGIQKNLKSLIDDGLIEKHEYIANNQRYCTYTTKLHTLYNKVAYPIQQSCTNNIDNINNNIISKDIIYSEKTDDAFLGSAKNKPKKESMYSKCVNLINDFTEDDKLRDMLVIFLNNCLEASKETGRPFYTNNFKGKLNQLKKFDEKDLKKIVKQTLDSGWLGFYELKTNNAKDLHTRINESGAGKDVIRGDKEGLKKAINNGTAKKY